MSTPENEAFLCEQPFEQYPELVCLIDMWGGILEERDQARAQGLPTKQLMRNAFKNVGRMAEAKLIAHYPYLDADAKVEELGSTTSGMWAFRAMLAAANIRMDAQNLTPEKFND